MSEKRLNQYDVNTKNGLMMNYKNQPYLSSKYLSKKDHMNEFFNFNANLNIIDRLEDRFHSRKLKVSKLSKK